MAKETIFTVKESGKPDRIVTAKNIAAVHAHLLGAVTVEKVTDPMTIASAITAVLAAGGKVEASGEVAALPTAAPEAAPVVTGDTPIEQAIKDAKK